MNHPLDDEIAFLIDNLLPLLRERGIRHASLFTESGFRLYLSHGTYNRQVTVDARSPAEALAALDAAIGAQRLLETMY